MSMVLTGSGTALAQAIHTAHDIGLEFRQLALTSADNYRFDLNELTANYTPTDTEIFIALDERAVNYARHKLIADIKLAGYRLTNIVSPKAIVAENVKLQGNVYIGPGCNISTDTMIGFGSWLERQVLIDSGCKLGACVTLKMGVQLGKNVEIGRGSTLGNSSIATMGTKIGRHCEWLLPGALPHELPDGSFFDDLMPTGARILG